MRFLWSAWPWRCWAHLLGGGAFGIAAVLLFVFLVVAGLALSVIGIGVPILAATALFGLPVGRFERRRLRVVEPRPVPNPHPPLPETGVWRRVRLRWRERVTWRELGYAALVLPVFAVVDVAFTALLGLSLVLVATPVVVVALSHETVMVPAGHALDGWIDALPVAGAGLAGVVLCAYVGALLVGVQVYVARLLLSPRDAETKARIVELTRSRARLVDAFEAERRRIERDLHDGAQQQLVALSITLGLAELELGGEHPRAAELLVRARGEARDALTGLRDLIQGIHPQVLGDHGLAAAVAEVAGRHPFPVTVDVDLPRRLPSPVETMAYFTVTEALTNSAKHSGATRVEVSARLADDHLVLDVVDDGHGGADPAAGAGLRGLADRLAILGGRLTVHSPVGGPTRIHVEVPCSG
nr:sensor histidine kinase [Streptomyces sp. SID3343]